MKKKKRQGKLTTLKVTAEELGRLTRYALAYRGGGFQNLIRDILKRNLQERV